MNKETSLFIVLGMHRSGTSAITRALKTVGVDLGDKLLPSANDNKKGFWEDRDITKLNDELLLEIGSSWDSYMPIKKESFDFLLNSEYKSKASDLLFEKLNGKPMFGIKDPRISRLLPFWKGVFSECNCNTRYVFAMRNPVSVAYSLHHRNGFHFLKSYILWLDYILTVLAELDENASIIVNYEELMTNPRGEISRLASWLNVPVDDAELSAYCDDFLDKELQHSQFTLSDIAVAETFSSLLKEVYSLLTSSTFDVGALRNVENAEKIKGWRAQFDAQKPILELLEQERVRNAEQLQQLVQECVRNAEQQQRLEQERQRMAVLMQEIHQSTSWRLTAPIRWLEKWVK